MAVKIRLTRRGRKKLARFDLVVADARSPRDGRFIEKIGAYNPQTNPATIEINEEKALDWLIKGAQPTDTARRILSYKGMLIKKHLQIGVLKGAITQEEADKRFAEWKETKEAKIAGKVDTLTKKRAETDKARLEAERKVKEAKAEAIKKKQAVDEPVDEVAEESPAAEVEVEEVQENAVEVEDNKTDDKEAAKTEEAKKEEKQEASKAEEVTEAKKEEAPEAKAEETKEAPAKESDDSKAEETKAEKKESPKAEVEDSSGESEEEKK